MAHGKRMKQKGIPYDPGRRAVTGLLLKGVALFTAYSAGAGFLAAGQLRGVFANSGNSGLEDRLNTPFELKGTPPSDGKYLPPTPQPTKEPAKPTPTPQPAQFTLEDFYKNPARYQKLVPNLSEKDLAALVRVVYNEVGLSEPMPEEAYESAWVAINRLNDKEIFSYANSIVDVILAPNQFQPVYIVRGKISSFFEDLADENRAHYPVLPKDMLDAHAQKLVNNGWKEEAARARVNEYGQQILNATLEVLAGKVPEQLAIEIEGVKYGALYFKNACTSDAANAVWHNRTPRQIWGGGRADRKLWFLERIGNTWYYALVPVGYDAPAKRVPSVC